MRLIPLFLLAILALPAIPYAQNQFVDVLTRDPATTNSPNRLCFSTNSRTDVTCPTTAPYVSNSTGFLGVGTNNLAAAFTINTMGIMENGLVIKNGLVTGTLIQTADGGSGFMQLYSGGQPQIVLDSRGNKSYISRGKIGLGTTDPQTTLHVSGTLRLANGGESCDTNRLGAIRYASGTFSLCQNTTNGWEPLATATSSTTPSINTGLSGSIVFRDEYGYLKANNTFSISATTGSVGIGAGAPASVGNNGLYVSGNITTYSINSGIGFWPNNTYGLHWGSGGKTRITGNGDATTQNIIFTTSNTEALRITSTSNVGIGTSSPTAKLDVSGSIKLSSDGAETCASSADYGKLRYNPTTGILQICVDPTTR